MATSSRVQSIKYNQVKYREILLRLRFQVKDLLHEQTYTISARVVNTTGTVSPPSDVFNILCRFRSARGRERELMAKILAPSIDLIEIAPASGDTYINRADMLSIDEGDAIPFTATIPLGSVAGDKTPRIH